MTAIKLDLNFSVVLAFYGSLVEPIPRPLVAVLKGVVLLSLCIGASVSEHQPH